MLKPKPREPISKIVLITHPLYSFGGREPLRENICMERGKAARLKLDELSGIIRSAAKSPGTHVIVSWSGAIPRHKTIVGMLKEIPRSRLHETEYNPEVMEHHEYPEANFFHDDSRLKQHLLMLKFEPKIEVESWGDFEGRCAAFNLYTMLSFLRWHGRSEVKTIRFLGGSTGVPLIDNVVQRGKRLKPSEREEFNAGLAELRGHLLNTGLRSSPDIEFASPLAYKPPKKRSK